MKYVAFIRMNVYNNRVISKTLEFYTTKAKYDWT